MSRQCLNYQQEEHKLVIENFGKVHYSFEMVTVVVVLYGLSYKNIIGKLLQNYIRVFDFSCNL